MRQGGKLTEGSGWAHPGFAVDEAGLLGGRKTKWGRASEGCAGRPIGEVPPNWETVSPGIERG